MWTDPIVEEIRREREAYAAKSNFDIEAICRDLQRQEQESGRDIVTLPLKRRAGSDLRLSERGENYEHHTETRN